MRELHRSEHWVVTVEGDLVRAVRTPRPYETIAQLEASLQALAVGMRVQERAGRKLLVDVRDGPFRNDDANERAVLRHRRALFKGFARVAVLVRTAVGRLQTNRIAREARDEHLSFLDEAEALAYLADRSA
jgi:hypothetical protein